MSTTRIHQFPKEHLRSLFGESARETGVALTVSDRVEIERLLKSDEGKHFTRPELLAGLPQHNASN